MLIRSEMLLSGMFFLWGLCGIVSYQGNDYKMWLLSIIFIIIGSMGVAINGKD